MPYDAKIVKRVATAFFDGVMNEAAQAIPENEPDAGLLLATAAVHATTLLFKAAGLSKSHFINAVHEEWEHAQFNPT
jgi:hypothetical protein